ncbi:chondroitin proteoglycan 1-like [Artemia franciscana]|uniref:chondroitin proteoglycan 1-like n=1 Tax=Artemia franciscana TaxID=6661 RepID=UPI0032DA36CB
MKISQVVFRSTTVPPFLVFNVDLETCDYDFNVPSPCGTLSASTSASFVCPEPNGYFSNPNSCLLFYICTDGTENIQYCAERLVYNPQKKTCDFPYNIQPLCGTLWTSTEAKTTHTTQQTSEAPILVTETTDSEAPSSETKLVSSTALPFVCPDPDGYFSNPNSCFSLYICIDGTGTIQYCAERLVYNPQKKTCDFPHNVNPPCGTCATYVCILGSTTHKKTSATPDKTTESGSPSRTTGHLPETTTSLVTTDLNSQITFAPSTSSPFVFPKPDGYFSNTEVCYSFYICYEGTENIRYCAEGLVYNPPKSPPGLSLMSTLKYVTTILMYRLHVEHSGQALMLKLHKALKRKVLILPLVLLIRLHKHHQLLVLSYALSPMVISQTQILAIHFISATKVQKTFGIVQKGYSTIL